MAPLAGGVDTANHVATGASSVAHALDLGQSGGTYDAGDGAVALQPRDHATVYTVERVMAEHDGIGAADSEAASVGRSAPADARGNYQLAGSDSPRVEPDPDAIRVGREARVAASAAASTRACGGRLGRMCSSAGAASPPQRASLTAIQLSTVHQRQSY